MLLGCFEQNLLDSWISLRWLRRCHSQDQQRSTKRNMAMASDQLLRHQWGHSNPAQNKASSKLDIGRACRFCDVVWMRLNMPQGITCPPPSNPASLRSACCTLSSGHDIFKVFRFKEMWNKDNSPPLAMSRLHGICASLPDSFHRICHIRLLLLLSAVHDPPACTPGH